MKGRVRWIAVAVLSLCILSNKVMAAEKERIPYDMDLIEFIGGWESEDGEWLDPELFDDALLGDAVGVEGESGLQMQDIKSRDLSEKGSPFLKGKIKEEAEDMRKEER